MGGFAFDGFVVGVERGTQQEERRDAAAHIGDVARFLFGEASAQECLFAIAEPLFDYLVSAEGVLPDAGRNVAPEGFAVEVDVVGRVVRARDGLAFAGHGDAALAAMSPPGSEIEVARIGIEVAGDGGEHADEAEFGTDGRDVHAWNGLFDIEQRGDLSPERGGGPKCGGAYR